MVTVRIRLGLLLAKWWLLERKQPPQAVSRVKMRCIWPDADINRHMNNSRYLALMDLGRYHFMLASGLYKDLFFKRGWFPVLVGVSIDFRKSIKPGDRFTLETRLVDSPGKAAILRQRFWLGDQLAAEATATALFLKGGKVQPLGDVHERYGHLLETAGEGIG